VAIGSTLAGVARVAVEVDTGTSEQKLAEFDRRFVQTTDAMNEGAIRVELASRRLQRTLAQYPADSDKALRATLALKAAQRSAAAETSTLARKTHESAGSFRTFAHDVERGGLGLAAGTRAVKGLRSALLFGGVGFASGFGISTFLRSARDAALDQQVALGQLQAALHAAGIEQSAYTGTVKEAIEANTRLGFSEDDTVKSFSLLVRATKDVESAHRLQGIAADLARGRNMDLVAASQLVTRVNGGMIGTARRLLPFIDKQATSTQALAEVQRRYAGSATAYADSAAGAQARLNVAIHQTEETIGTALLPTITSLNTRLANWLDKSQNQKRIQADVNSGVREAGHVVHGLAAAFHAAQIVLGPVNRLLGGTSNSVRDLGILLGGLKLRSLAADMNLFGLKTKQAGANAAVAAGEYRALAGAEGTAAAGGAAGGRGGFLAIPNVGIPATGTRGVVGRINQYTATGAGATAAAGLSLGLLGSLALGGFGAQQDAFNGGQDAYLDDVKQKWKINNPALGGKPAKPGSVFDINGKRYLVTYKNGAAYLYSREYLEKIAPVNTKLSATQGAGPHGAAALGAPTRRPTSLQGQYNIAALKLAEAGRTATTTDDDVYLNQQLAITDKQIAREKNLAKKTQLVDQRNGILAQLQQNRDQRTQAVADAARKRATERQRATAARERAARTAESRRFGTATDVLQRLSGRARLERGRGQFDAERETLKAEEHDLEGYIKDASLSVQHRRTLQRRLTQVRQQIDDIGRQIRAAAAKHAAARDARQELLIQRAEAAAALTDEKDDDLRAYRAEEKIVNRKIAALSRLKHLTNQQLQDQTNLLQQKKQIEDQIKGLAGSGTSGAALARELRDAVSGLAQYAPNVTAALASVQGGTVVHQHLHFPGSGRPTPDYNQEMIFSRHALTAAFDG
jgi:hypothetical protein